MSDAFTRACATTRRASAARRFLKACRAFTRESIKHSSTSSPRDRIQESRPGRLLGLLSLCFLAPVIGTSIAHAQSAMNPLVISILAEDIEGVRAALDSGISPNAIDPELQRSALHIAVSPGSPRSTAVLELLASKGADLNAEDEKTKLTPIMAATIVADPGNPTAALEFQRSKRIVERLLDLGTDPGRATKAGETPLLVAVRRCK